MVLGRTQIEAFRTDRPSLGSPPTAVRAVKAPGLNPPLGEKAPEARRALLQPHSPQQFLEAGVRAQRVVARVDFQVYQTPRRNVEGSI